MDAPVFRLLELVTVCVLQFLLNLSHRQVAEAVRCEPPALAMDSKTLYSPGAGR